MGRHTDTHTHLFCPVLSCPVLLLPLYSHTSPIMGSKSCAQPPCGLHACVCAHLCVLTCSVVPLLYVHVCRYIFVCAIYCSVRM